MFNLYGGVLFKSCNKVMDILQNNYILISSFNRMNQYTHVPVNLKWCFK